MVKYTLKRILSVIPHLLIVTIILFVMISLLPGTAADLLLGDNADVEMIAQVEERLGLDQPIYVQYGKWLLNTLKGDLGVSYFTGLPVVDRIAERLPVTIELIILSMTVAIIIGVPIGILCAVYRNKPLDYFFSTVSMIEVSMPSFWTGMLLIILFSVTLGWLPASGFVPFLEDPMQNLKSMILPVIATGMAMSATIIRQMRSAMLDVLGQDYIMTGKAKGMGRLRLYFKHGLRNALIPVVTAITSQISNMIGGSVVVESVYLIPGMGKSLIDAIFQRDYPVVMGEALVIAVLIVLLNTAVDLLYSVIDPRVSREIKK